MPSFIAMVVSKSLLRIPNHMSPLNVVELEVPLSSFLPFCRDTKRDKLDAVLESRYIAMN